MTPQQRRLFGFSMPAALALVCAAGACSGAAAAAQAEPQNSPSKSSPPKIYKYVKDGTTSFADVPPSKGAYVVHRTDCYACAVVSNVDWYSTQLHLNAYGDEIAQAAQQYALDPALVRAVIHAESGFNPRARSPKGAMGLMQLMPGTARMLGVTTAYVPSQNILGGAKYLASLLARFKNDITLAAAAYNAGPEAVKKHAGVPPYAETQVYVQRVKILHQRYRDGLR
jgi:soluble lytic murein transglycosylase-like protein